MVEMSFILQKHQWLTFDRHLSPHRQPNEAPKPDHGTIPTRHLQLHATLLGQTLTFGEMHI